MFTIKFKDGSSLAVDTVQESLMNYNDAPETVLVLQSTTQDKLDLVELEGKILETVAEITVYEGKRVADKFVDYTRIISINKTLRVSSGLYFYDIQLGK